MASRVFTPRIHTRASLRIFKHLTPTRTALRRYATEPPTLPPTQGIRKPTRSGAFYKNFGSPILKTFLGALFTYQLTYYGWMKLEAVEEQSDHKDEVQDLKDELTDLLRQKADAERMLKEVQAGTLVAGTVDEVPKETKKGWFW